LPLRARRGLAAAGTFASALVLCGALAAPAGAAAATRVALPDPNYGTYAGTASATDTTQTMALRVYLSGQNPQGRVAAATAVSDPQSPLYADYLTPTAYTSLFGPAAAQISAVTGWLTGAGMTVTSTNAHYIAVSATVAQVNAAFDTQITTYTSTQTITLPNGRTITITNVVYGATGGFSVPAAMGPDIATVTGLGEFSPSVNGTASASTATRSAAQSAQQSAAKSAANAAAKTPATKAAAKTSADTAYQCSQYWGQNTESIPAAYGKTSAPTGLCGYTVSQMRSAYGISSSPYTGKGSTIAVVLNSYSPTMLADANQYFADQGVPGFAPGQYTEDFGGDGESASSVDASCQGDGEPVEEAIDVETSHIAAPDANVVYVGTDCALTGGNAGQQQDFLDAMSNIVDQHLADVVTDSFSINASAFSAADAAAFELTFEQGAIEGIGFDFASGDGGDNADPEFGQPATVSYPASDPWVTGVGGTSLAIGANGTPVAEYGWGDNTTEETADGTGYTAPPPGQFGDGSTGGLSTLFAEPGYQQRVVPTALATDGGTESAHRVSPDISADAGLFWMIGFTGATTDGVYGEIPEGGGTSGASPLIAGLEADAKQADGHAVGFANPAIYQLACTPAIHDVLPIDPADPPITIGAQPGLGTGNDFLATLGEDSSLNVTPGYDDVTGVGSATPAFVTAFGADVAQSRH
jgi:subtilase family serine protease